MRQKIGVHKENYLKDDTKQVCLIPYVSVFWNTDKTLALVVSLWIIEFQLWIGSFEEGVIKTVYNGTA